MAVISADGVSLGSFLGMIGDEIEYLSHGATPRRVRIPADWVASMDGEAARLNVTKAAISRGVAAF